jgi:hypothetical protein
VAEQETNGPLVIDPNALDLDVASGIVTDALPPEAEANALFIAGDHWQDASGWVGPIPPTEDTDREDTLRLIRTAFTSRNVLREIVMRRVRGVIGKEPRFGVVPRIVTDEPELAEETKRRKLEIEAALTDWWDRRKVHKALERATTRACWATRGPLRVYIPAALAPSGEIPRQPDLASALRYVHVEALDPFNATVAEDADTGDEVGILLTANAEEEPVAELVFLADDPTTPVGERVTVFRTITEDTEVPDDDEDAPTTREGDVTMELGGRITMAVIESDLLITTQLQQMQRALNLCLTMIPHNIVTGGFLERIILNGLPPGHWERDSNGRKTRFIREAFETGPGVTSWVSGIEIPGTDGKPASVTSPTVAWRPPTDPEFASKAKRSIYQDMLEEADQAHVLLSGDAVASAVSRVQARADFDMSLTQLEGPVNAVGRWLVEVVLALAESLMQQPNAVLKDWRGQFECRVTSAPLSVEERTQNVTEMKEGLLSRETAQERNGVADVAAENARISSDPDFQLRTLKTRADITGVLSQAGADIVAAATVAGIEDAASLLPTDVPDVPDDGTEGETLPTDGGTDDGTEEEREEERTEGGEEGGEEGRGE